MIIVVVIGVKFQMLISVTKSIAYLLKTHKSRDQVERTAGGVLKIRGT